MNPVAIQKEMSAKTKLVISFMGLLVFVFVSIFFLVWKKNVRTIEDDVNRRISAIPSILAMANQKQIMENDFVNLQDSLNYIIEQVSRTAEISYMYVLDAKGVPIAEEFSQDLLEKNKKAIRDVIFRSGIGKNKEVNDVDKLMQDQRNIEESKRQRMYKSPHRQVIKINDTEIIDIFIPINKFNTSWGAIRAGFQPKANTSIRATRNILVILMVLSLAISFVFALLLGGHFTDHTIRIVDETEKDLTFRLQREFKKRMEKVEDAGEEFPDERSNIPADAAQISKEEFFTLLDISKQIHGTLKYEDILHIAVNSVVRLLKIRELTIFTLTADQSTLQASIGYNTSGLIPEEELEGIQIPIGHGDIGVSAQFGTTNLIDEPRPGTAVVSALVTRGSVIGTVLVRNKISGKSFVATDKLLLRQAVTMIANALENARMYEERAGN